MINKVRYVSRKEVRYAERKLNPCGFVFWNLIGGFALAARWAGIKTVQFVEIDPFCQKVLQKNFPGVPIHDDIKTFTYTEGARQLRETEHENNGKNSKRGWGYDTPNEDKNASCNESTLTLPAPFILTGGFPCQPFSAPAPPEGEGFK